MVYLNLVHVVLSWRLGRLCGDHALDLEVKLIGEEDGTAEDADCHRCDLYISRDVELTSLGDVAICLHSIIKINEENEYMN